jgi:hypothetical protein
MADHQVATPFANASGFCLRACSTAHLEGSRYRAAQHDLTGQPALNLTPRFVRGFPYPFTFDSVRCHA